MINPANSFQYILLIAIFLASGVIPGLASAAGPSFDCSKIQQGSVEDLICEDKELSILDQKMASVYAEATRKAINEHPPLIKAEQRGWIKGRNECWKSEDMRQCVAQSYKRRIAELQARYRLLSAKGPFWYSCNGNPSDEVVVTFFETDPPTLVAERGDQVSLMYLQPSGRGSKYQGRNESLWEQQGEATIVWGYGRPEMRCTRRSSSALPASTEGTAEPTPGLADLPVENMTVVHPDKYRKASEFAARGSAPLHIVLKIVGEFEGATQHIIEVNEGGEAPSASRITVLRDGLMDDSVRGERWEVVLERPLEGIWHVQEVKRAWRCWRGEKLNRFRTVICP